MQSIPRFFFENTLYFFIHTCYSNILRNLSSSSLKVRSMQDRVILTGLSSSMWTDAHNQAMLEFVVNTSRQVMLVYMDEQNGLTVCSTFPAFDMMEMAYFAREEYASITMENLAEALQFGTIHGTYVDGLLKTMHGLYAPTFFENQSWPDSKTEEGVTWNVLADIVGLFICCLYST